MVKEEIAPIHFQYPFLFQSQRVHPFQSCPGGVRHDTFRALLQNVPARRLHTARFWQNGSLPDLGLSILRQAPPFLPPRLRCGRYRSAGNPDIFFKPSQCPEFPLDNFADSVYIISRRRIARFPASRHVARSRRRTCRPHNRSPRGSGGTADTLALGASAARREGSNPSFPILYIERLQKPPYAGVAQW